MSPSCRAEVIPTVVNLLLKWKPESVLEVGPGFGKWGVLLREYLEIWGGEYHKDDWKCKIDAIEIFEDYRNPIWDYVYDEVYIGSVMDYLDILKNYDVVLLIDVIEHLIESDGRKVLNNIPGRYIVSTPNYRSYQGASFGNIHETHMSFWHYSDFSEYDLIEGRWVVAWGP